VGLLNRVAWLVKKLLPVGVSLEGRILGMRLFQVLLVLTASQLLAELLTLRIKFRLLISKWHVHLAHRELGLLSQMGSLLLLVLHRGD
jgi:hypothetical protein